MSKKRKLLLTLALVALVGLAVLGTFAAFTATTSNTGNSISAGTVSIGNNVATPLYNVADQKPLQTTTKCIRITYSGNLTADVFLYATGLAADASYFNLKVERGSFSGSFAENCTGFTASSTAFDADLNTFGSTYATGISGKAAAATWANGNSVDYKFTVQPKDDSTPNAHSTTKSSGTHAFVWEARNTP
jgi:predicted ribosomally synthesized peptide with SipW-like signal peptide